MRIGERHPLAWLLATEPRRLRSEGGGTESAASLAGRHRFARYALVFDLADVADGETLLSARTYADFRGPHGRVYRALVIGTRAHVVATKHVLRSIRRLTLS